MSDNTTSDVITGSASPLPVGSGRATFRSVPPVAGHQKSHTIPQKLFNRAFADLFAEIRIAELPAGQLPFDPDNFYDNRQCRSIFIRLTEPA